MLHDIYRKTLHIRPSRTQKISFIKNPKGLEGLIREVFYGRPDWSMVLYFFPSLVRFGPQFPVEYRRNLCIACSCCAKMCPILRHLWAHSRRRSGIQIGLFWRAYRAAAKWADTVWQFPCLAVKSPCLLNSPTPNFCPNSTLINQSIVTILND